MSNQPDDIRASVERHNREIAELRHELRALKDGQAKRELEAEIQKRLAELEADVNLQALQETLAKEEAEKDAAQRKRRRPFRFW